MIKYVLQHTPSMLFYALLSIGATVSLGVSEVLIIKIIVELIFQNVEFEVVLKPILIYSIIIIVSYIIISIYDSYLRHRCRYIYTKKMQRIMFEKAKCVDVSCYDDPTFFNKFTRAMREGDIKGVNVFDDVMYLIQSIAMVVALGSIIILGDVVIIFIALLQCFISFICAGHQNKINYQHSKTVEPEKRRYDYISRVFYLESYVNEVKTTPIKNVLTHQYKHAAKKEQQKYKKTFKKLRIYQLIDTISYSILNISNYIYIFYRIIKGALTIGDFTSLTSAINKFTHNVDLLLYAINKFKENSLYIDDYIWFMDYKPSMELRIGEEITNKQSTLSVEHVSFRYNEGESLVLNDISLMVKPGEKIAIVGHNGAGKTSLIKLLLKFYLPESGKIIINDHNYLDINEISLRKQFASIFQNFQIYSITVAENVLLRHVTNEDDINLVWYALEKAGLKDKIEKLPNQLNTRLTKEFDASGLVLSGGERQKLALARVFASNAPILILDEPSSALDPIAEYEINKTLIETAKDKTVILISHRLSTVVDANKIYLIEQGKVIESGSHHELLKLKGKYFEMFETQASLYREEAC
ncbi:MAG: transporter related protein [Haloplasmataceae bacterium]|nr:transporter related protein [Haloplasmataceae bacterium]